MFRGYDSSEVFCEDTLLRIKHLYQEIVTMQKSMEGLTDTLKQENLTAPKPNRETKSQPGTGRSPKKRRNDPDSEH